MKSFDEVTRTTQRKWLKQLAEVALQRYGITDAQLTFISESCLTVFRVETEGHQYALRIDPEQAVDKWRIMTEAELQWLLALKHDTDLPVPEPAVANDGTLVQTVVTEKIPDGRIVTLLHWMPGKLIGKNPSLDIQSQMGSFMAHLHEHSQQFSFSDGVARDHTDWGKLRDWHDPQNDTSATLTTEERDLCAKASQRLLTEIDQIGTETNYGLIHADMTPNNCLAHEGQLRVIDFADCRYSSHFYDMAVPLSELVNSKSFEAKRAAFFEGYSQIRPLGKGYEAGINTFMVSRAFDIVEWIHLDWPSPTYHSYGPALLAKAIGEIREYLG